ncbi:MAG: glycoside hydrolase family 31 protein, partial [Saprospiraceae bacterium]|nr:glycoside hydrolase family 31 protein [Saprospiraceae bacterium]
AFGLLSSHSRLHGSSSYRVPWLFDEEAVDVLRHFTRLKCSLMPYLFDAAQDAHYLGIPMMRAMHLEFPNDRGCDTLDRQYMLGSDLLVAPVFTPDGTVDFYLPAGKWTHFFTGQVSEGGRWLRECHSFTSLPLMVRPNTILPVGANDQRPDYDFAEGVTFHIFELADGANLVKSIYGVNGEKALTLRVIRLENEITLQSSDESKNWKVLLRGLLSSTSISGGTIKQIDSGLMVTAESNRIKIILQQH